MSCLKRWKGKFEWFGHSRNREKGAGWYLYTSILPQLHLKYPQQIFAYYASKIYVNMSLSTYSSGNLDNIGGLKAIPNIGQKCLYLSTLSRHGHFSLYLFYIWRLLWYFILEDSYFVYPKSLFYHLFSFLSLLDYFSTADIFLQAQSSSWGRALTKSHLLFTHSQMRVAIFFFILAFSSGSTLTPSLNCLPILKVCIDYFYFSVKPRTFPYWIASYIFHTLSLVCQYLSWSWCAHLWYLRRKKKKKPLPFFPCSWSFQIKK